MLSPTSLQNEARRLAALREYEVLDSPPEQALDDLTVLAAQVCAAPISLISLTDETRQGFKSSAGLEREEEPRAFSFCARVLGLPKFLMVPDAQDDERLADHPFVWGEAGVRFHAGVPLVTHSGAVLGTLCVIDRVPRTLTAEQERALCALGRQVMTHLELRKRSRELAGSEALFRTIFELEPECVMLLSADGRVRMMNPAGLRLLEADPLQQPAGDTFFNMVAEEDRAQFIELTESVFQGEACALKYRIVGLKGTAHWLDIQAVPLRDERGTVTALLGISRNITEQHQAEQALAEKSLQLQAALKVASLGVWSWDFRLNKVAMLQTGGPISGLPKGGAPRCKADFLGLVHPDDRAAVEESIRRAQAGNDFADKFRIVLPDGEVRWVAAQGRCLPDAEGALSILTGVDQDITEQKLSSDLRQMSESRYRTLFESAPDGIMISTADGRYIDANPSACRMLGYEDGELIGMSAMDLVVPREGQHIEPALAEVSGAAVHQREWELKRKDGSRFTAEVLATLMPDNTFLTIARDISQRKEAEAQLRLLETCVARLNEIVMITEAESLDEPGPRILFVNEAFTRITGYSPEEAIGRSPRFLQGPKTCRATLDRVRAALLEFKPVHAELINYRKNGQEYWVEMDIVPVTDHTGRCTHLMAVEREITERKRYEARFRWLVDSNAQGVLFWKVNGEITEANDAFLTLIGHSREDLEAGRLNWAKLTPAVHTKAEQRALAELAAKGICTPYEKEYLRKDGTTVPVLAVAAVFPDNPNEGVGFILDLTERKRLEQQFLRAQRMESIGTLAGGIAHDLNNSLGPILTSIELLQMRFPDPASQELLTMIEASARRGADMVRQVLSFARGVEGRRMEVQIKHVVQEIQQIVNDTFLKHIEMRTIFPGNLRTIIGDPTQLHQVLLNLCVNARDAMPDGGLLTVSVDNVDLDEQYAALHPEARPGSYVRIKVEDREGHDARGPPP